MSQLTEVFNEQLENINQYNERRFVIMILDKTKEAAEKTFLADGPEDLKGNDTLNSDFDGYKGHERRHDAGKTLLCEPLEAPYRPGAQSRREDAEKVVLSGSGTGPEKKERPKHCDILDAMVHLNRTVFIVQKLCDDIVGVKEVNTQTPVPNKKPEKGPCLLEVLERTPGNIHAACNMIKETVKEIRAQIL